MKTQRILTLNALLLTAISIASPSVTTAPDAPSIAFTENKGQVHDQNFKPRPDILFGVMAGDLAVHIRNTGISYQLNRVDSYKELKDHKTHENRKVADKQTTYRVDMDWLNCNNALIKSTDNVMEGHSNYYFENCPGGALFAKTYTGISLNNIYNGINLHYYEKGGELKHDYIVAAQANYKQIQLRVEGAEITTSSNGGLVLTTPLGKILEGAPIVFQNGKQLSARWLVSKNILSFEIDNYNANYELIIDPVTRLWGTYYGGSSGETVAECKADATGNIYLCGSTSSSGGGSTIIATTGAHNTVYQGFQDAFLVKFNASGTRLWGTYYGGIYQEDGRGCTTDAQGNVYMCGTTESTTTATFGTPGCHQQNFAGGNNDAFLVKFDGNGVRTWGTFYGGTAYEYGESCATDAAGNVYLAGFGGSSNGLATAGSHQNVFAGGNDAYLVKFNSSGLRQWGTYYGDYDLEESWSCATDLNNNVYLAGMSQNAAGTIIATAGAHQANSDGSLDGFLVKFNSTGVRQWGTYYGGAGSDQANACAADASGNIILVGTMNFNVPPVSSVGSHQPTHGGGVIDAFVAKFTTVGTRLWGTYYGGNGGDYGHACATDAVGNVYLAGSSNTSVGISIATPGSHQPTCAVGYDAYLAKFNASGVRQWGTYYGGSDNEDGFSCTADGSGNVFLAGDARCDNNISSAGSHQSIRGGQFDGFLAKFDACNAPAMPGAISGATLLCPNSGAATYSIAPVAGALSYAWYLPAGSSGAATGTSISATVGSTGVFSVSASNACGESVQRTLTVTLSSCAGLEEATNPGALKVFPNPTKGIITVMLEKETELTVVNVTGQVVLRAKLNSGGHQIDLEKQAAGIYFLNTSDHSRPVKIIKE